MGRGVTGIVGGGLMMASETNVLLSRSLNFSLQFGVEWHGVRVQYRHFSNGGTHLPNLGQNLLTAGWRF